MAVEKPGVILRLQVETREKRDASTEIGERLFLTGRFHIARSSTFENSV